MTATEPTQPPNSDSPAGLLVRGLSRVIHRGESKTLGALLAWRPGVISMPVLDVTAYADTDIDYHAHALTAHAFAVWHSQRALHTGRSGTSITRAARQLGKTGSYGPADPGATRLVDRLLHADTLDELYRALHTLMRALRQVDHPPHWETLAHDLTTWQDPSKRDDVRLMWGRAFYTSARPAPAATTEGPPNDA